MKYGVFSRIKADGLTLVLVALLAVAAVWLLADQLTGAKNLLADRLFTFALGIFLGNALRILGARDRAAPGTVPTV